MVLRLGPQRRLAQPSNTRNLDISSFQLQQHRTQKDAKNLRIVLLRAEHVAASVQFNGNNLLDKKYYVLDEYDDTYYGPPASYGLGVNVRFQVSR